LIYTVSIAFWTKEVFADFIIGDFLTVVALMIGLAAKTLFTERAQRRQFDTSELLQQSYTMVEQQVRERTAELQVTNTMLTTEIDERKRAEEQINKINNDLLQKTAELEQLVYVASHDLRSPLVNVQGFSRELGLLAEEIKEITSHAGLPDKQQARLSDIVNKEFPEARNYILASVVKMDTLLNGLLKLSRLGRAAVTLQKIDMNEMLISVLKTMEFQVKQSGVSVEITPLPSCVGDPVQTNQVFTNLLDNAVKYRDPNRPGIIRITGKTVKNFSEYCVEDNGIGIAPEHQSRVFEIFRRLDPQATEGDGLGLTIVKKIVSRLNGSIRLESEAGRGSRFFVTLPGK
jgi:signal transduction histidine kinase